MSLFTKQKKYMSRITGEIKTMRQWLNHYDKMGLPDRVQTLVFRGSLIPVISIVK